MHSGTESERTSNVWVDNDGKPRQCETKFKVPGEKNLVKSNLKEALRQIYVKNGWQIIDSQDRFDSKGMPVCGSQPQRGRLQQLIEENKASGQETGSRNLGASDLLVVKIMGQEPEERRLQPIRAESPVADAGAPNTGERPWGETPSTLQDAGTRALTPPAWGSLTHPLQEAAAGQGRAQLGAATNAKQFGAKKADVHAKEPPGRQLGS
jgi:hypothetical protein